MSIEKMNFKRWVHKVLPAVYDESLSYYELLCKVIHTLNEVIEQSNGVAEGLVDLKEYVEHYFDNLDIQEEVNNKLDEMAQSGELAEIIAQYVELAGVLAYDTKADMKTAQNINEGSICKTLGNLTYSDGQGAFYRVREILNTDVIDDENIIALYNPELVAEKILYSSGYDLQIQITNNTEKIEEYTKNSKYVAPMFLDTSTRQELSYVTEFLTKCKNAGFKEAQMIIHIENDGTLVEDSSKFADYDSIATSLGIPITSIKFHGSYSSINYLATIISTIGDFDNIQTCFIFNEQLSNCLNYGLTYPATIKATYPNIKVGFTSQYNGLYQTTFTYDNWQSLINAYDILGLNIYPSCTSFSDSKNCSFDKVLDSFNSLKNMIPWTKEMWITESGVLPYWQFLELPEGYNLSLLTDTTKTIEPQRIFFTALDKCDLSQKANKICPWFLESGMSNDTEELFTDILKNIILKR